MARRPAAAPATHDAEGLSRATATSADAMFEFGGEWSANFITSIPQRAFDDITMESELRRDPTLWQRPTERERQDGRAALALIASNRGFANLTRQSLRYGGVEAAGGASDLAPSSGGGGSAPSSSRGTSTTTTSTAAASLPESLVRYTTVRERHRGGGYADGDDGDDDDTAAAEYSSSDDDNGDDADTLYVFERQRVREPVAAATHFRVAPVPWDRAPAPLRAQDATPYALLDGAQRRHVTAARAGSVCDEVEAALMERRAGTRLTSARLASELARAGASYEGTGAARCVGATPALFYYMYRIDTTLHVVCYAERVAAAAVGAPLPDEPLAWRGYFYFANAPAAVPPETATTPTTPTATTATMAAATTTTAPAAPVLGRAPPSVVPGAAPSAARQTKRKRAVVEKAP